mmetsp:Transcript_34239/g.75017  ORF Transcript_34239/g.75017 Transcript_34239/m.75017 type:complete len:197 (+) Transcript_34239:191-781(+)|eukprot:CAMPEP_0178489224 /NCGR_PEP_ID=MMETSP0696-20121128/10266_1 /TAXON_ID=265572 /ORGANISM="Extubocellulus spinifer, Strain CCMP396" /LENGTH=196 /DNA_ID=CAMNT_0020117019 /DNA_START=111 /DNA_END=701 /DNA_ORIENTATION=+
MTGPEEHSMAKTPLHREWVLWYDNPRLAPEGTTWRENLKECGSFSSVETFWEVFNNVKPASQLSTNSNYHIFMKGVEPMWEDKSNVKGGKFVLSIPKKESKSGRLDESWLFTALAVIGETIDASGDEVCGTVVSIRKSQDRVALWLKSCNPEKCITVGERWKKALQVSAKTSMKYQSHEDAAASGSSFKNKVLFEV